MARDSPRPKRKRGCASRFHQSHVLDKVRGRLHRDPVLCHFVLSSSVLWLLETYFRVRGIGYLGEVEALN